MRSTWSLALTLCDVSFLFGARMIELLFSRCVALYAASQNAAIFFSLSLSLCACVCLAPRTSECVSVWQGLLPDNDPGRSTKRLALHWDGKHQDE